MIIVDASALADALARDGMLGKQARGELARDAHWAAPEHLVVETFSTIRGLYVGGKIGAARAAEAVQALEQLTLDLLPTQPLLSRMWALHAHITGYDAAYVAAAETQRCPLVTGDQGLAHAAASLCDIRLTNPTVQ